MTFPSLLAVFAFGLAFWSFIRASRTRDLLRSFANDREETMSRLLFCQMAMQRHLNITDVTMDKLIEQEERLYVQNCECDSCRAKKGST
jgi:hypothetical protein